jgi:hypothetical protein
MFTNSDYYDLDSAQSKINQMKLMLDLRVKIDALEQVLVQRNIIGNNDIEACTKYLKVSPEYKALYDYLETQEKGVKNCKNDPQQYLRDLFKAKMDGSIK